MVQSLPRVVEAHIISTSIAVDDDTATLDRDGRRSSVVWTIAALAALSPLLVTLCLTLWRTPVPLSESVALLEDVARRAPARFLIPETPYYRPLFHLTLSAIWHFGGSLNAKLAAIRLVHITAIALLLVLFVRHLRPRAPIDAALAAVAAMILVGSPGFRDNLEIPLTYTIVGMAVAAAVWTLLNGQSSRVGAEKPPGPVLWRAIVIIALVLVAIGFKEQGLVLVPVVVVAWWTGAPGVNRGLAATVAAIAVAYLALRLGWKAEWHQFEQAVGLGFTELEPENAVARFGAFPYWLYAYSAASTVANVLFSEPSRGVFRIVRDISQGNVEPWAVNNIFSSLALTGVITWWGVTKTRKPGPWSPESRLFLALVIALLSCGVLSFNYSRDRLGGMATVFYAMAAFFALRAAAARIIQTGRVLFAAGSLGLVLLASSWCIRAVGTLEYTRLTAERNQEEWVIGLPERQAEFASRPVYLQIMHDLAAQGTAPHTPRRTPYPHWLMRMLGSS